MTKYHPDIDKLTDFSVGSMSVFQSLLVSTHIELCSSCSKSYRELTILGGEILRNISEKECPKTSLIIGTEFLYKRKKYKLSDSKKPIWNVKIILDRYKSDRPEKDQEINWTPTTFDRSVFLITLIETKEVKLFIFKSNNSFEFKSYFKEWKTGELVVLRGCLLEQYFLGDFIIFNEEILYKDNACADCVCLVLLEG